MSPEDDPLLPLLARWRDGDRTALDALLVDVQPWLHREMSLAMGKQPRDGEDSIDLAQSAIVNFLTRGPRFVPQDGAQFRALLKRIAKNELIDRWRRRQRGGGRHLDSLVNSANPLSGFAAAGPSGSGPSGQAAHNEDREWVRLALQFLDEEDRYLLLASEVEGEEWATIAAELGLAGADTARMRATRLRPRLANILRRLRAGNLPPGDTPAPS